MENKEDKSTETSVNENKQLSREEILASSRKENKQGDEREINIFRKGLQIAFCIGIILIGVISLVNTLVVGSTPSELWIVYMGMTAVWSFYYLKAGKRKPLFIACGVICSIACVLFTVSWILGLCGVEL